MVTKMLNFNYISQLVPKIQVIVQQKIAETGMLSIQRNDVEEYKAFDLLELTTTIASTVMLELFFGGSSFDAGSLNIKGVKLNHFIRHTFDLLLKQLLSPMTFLLGPMVKLGLRSNDRALNRQIILFREFTQEFVTRRV